MLSPTPSHPPGHVVLLANKVQELSLTRESIATNASCIPEWDVFWSYIQQQNSLQASDAWECGLPSTMDAGGMDSESEFDNELDLEPSSSGGVGVGVGGGMHAGPDYRYGSFQMASGGSDDQEGSDEEEEEEGGGGGVGEGDEGGAGTSHGQQQDEQVEEVTGMTATMTIEGSGEQGAGEEEGEGDAAGEHGREQGEGKGAAANGDADAQQHTTQGGS